VRASLLGIAALTPVALLQTGILRHLPDPPFPGFDSDRANLSDAAFRFGVPDGVLALASLVLNLPLARAGGPGRARRRPWIPLLVAAKVLGDAAGAGAYFSRMARGKDPWCAYCIAGAAADALALAAVLPEAREALGHLRSRGHRAGEGRGVAGSGEPA